MPKHRMLDLDLDFFLDNVAEGRSDTDSRLDDSDYQPWGEAQVREFLEKRCGLSRSKPIPGRLITHHDGAFFWWRKLIERGELHVPFDVVHVDAHSDTGGPFSYRYIMTELLHLPPEERANPQTGPRGLNPGNYLCFAAACRWLRSVVYVLNPKVKDDFGVLHFKDKDPYSGALQLKKCTVEDMTGFFNAVYGPSKFEPEPEIPFEMVIELEIDEPFTHGVLCQSPGFTPPAADALIPVIMGYFAE